MLILGWLEPNENGNVNSTNEARCKICKVAIRAHITDLKKHSVTKGHVRRMKSMNPTENKQLTNFVTKITNEENELRHKISGIHCYALFH